MTPAGQQLLAFFNSLPDADKHQVAIEILRRMTAADEGDLSEAALLGAADELFLALDVAESRHANP